MATLAVIENGTDGSVTIRPAVQADIDAMVAPRVDAQMASEITAVEQRVWQQMTAADTATAVNVETSVFGKVKAALQAALAYLGG